MKLSGFMQGFGATTNTCAPCALATDGFKSDSHVLMIGIHTFDDTEISVFVSGGDPMASQRYHGIPKQVYDSLSVDRTVVAEVLKSRLHDMGISILVCQQAHRFVRPRLQEGKLVDNTISFIDVSLIHKALQYWTGNLSEATNLIDLQGKIERLRGKNRISLDDLAAYYEVGTKDPASPYIPMNKAWQVREIFQRQLDTELSF